MSRRHLSSLKRGMEAMTVLAMVGRITASQLAKRINVPRTTAHRILDTLVAEGYATHNVHNYCYQLTPKVRLLAQGQSREAVIAGIARPILRELCRETLLANGLITPVGRDLVLQVAMDREAPLSRAQLPEGFYFPVTFNACGWLFLAHCSEEVRIELISSAMNSGPQYLTAHTAPRVEELQAIRELGYAVSARPGAPEGVLAVPVYLHGDYVASVHIRFTNHENAAADAVGRYLDMVRMTAARIEQELTASQSDGVERRADTLV